jgi:hypothetical protein
MKKTSIAILVLAAVFQMGDASAIGMNNSKFHEQLLTNDEIGLEDPYYQLKKMQVRELSDEEALQFNNEESLRVNLAPNIISKNFIGSIPGGLAPTIPPMPPQADPGIPGGSSPAPQPPTGVFGSIIMVIDKLIAIGEKIIPTIEK